MKYDENYKQKQDEKYERNNVDDLNENCAANDNDYYDQK